MGRETYTGDVAFEVRGHLGLITLNRPQAVNALTALMCESILLQLEDWAEDDQVQQVLIRGAGDRGLCAGGDVIAMYKDMAAHQDHDGGPLLPEGTPGYQAIFETETFFAWEYTLNHAIAHFPKPYVALMDGLVLGGGIGISAHGSHRIVTERTRTGMPETTIGFSPDVGGSRLLGQAGPAGLYAGLSAAHLNAADALYLNLADAFVESSRLEDLTQELAEQHVDEVLPRFAVSTAQAGTAVEPAVASEPSPMPGKSMLAGAEWIREAYAADDVELILAVLDELGASEPQAAQAAVTLRAKSPVAVKVAHRSLTTASELTLAGALIQEYTIGMHMLRSHDFREGIRAQVVDKDREPQWNPGSLTGVDDDLVNHYFSPVPHKILELPGE